MSRPVEPRAVPAGWPALVLTAGRGDRLRPLSLLRAKPALPVAGVPLAGRILRWLAASGIRDALLNLHHLPASVTAAVGDGSAHGLRVRYSWEREILGSAGGPAHALPLLASDRFFIVNGDTLTDVDLAGLAEAHLASGARVTMSLIANPDPGHFGGVSVAPDGAITGFTPRGPANPGLHFIGAQAVNADVFAGLDQNAPAETVMGIYREMMRAQPGSVRAFVSDAAFQDIGTAYDYRETCLRVAGQEGQDDGLAGSRVHIAPDARVIRSILWDDVRVGSGARIENCVIADGVTVPEGTRFTGLVIRRGDTTEPDEGETRAGELLVSDVAARRRPSPGVVTRL